jgi:hypothetical protein
VQAPRTGGLDGQTTRRLLGEAGVPIEVTVKFLQMEGLSEQGQHECNCIAWPLLPSCQKCVNKHGDATVMSHWHCQECHGTALPTATKLIQLLLHKLAGHVSESRQFVSDRVDMFFRALNTQ